MSAEQIEAAARAIRDAVRISIRPNGGTMELLKQGHTFHLTSDEAKAAAVAVIAAIHPTVTTVEELDALPIGSVLLGATGAAIEFTGVAEDGTIGVAPGSAALWTDDDLHLPATVLHMGGAA